MKFFIAFFLFFITNTALASPPVPKEEWTEETKLNLTKALIAEAGWNYCNDWALIPWVIAKRRNQMIRNGHEVTFNDVLLAYSSPLKPKLASKAAEYKAKRKGDRKAVRQVYRRRFIQSIRFDGSNIKELVKRFKRRSKATVLERRWDRAKAFVEAWGRGEVRDRCPGAMHWDMPNSRPNWIRKCTKIDTHNHFYKGPRDQK